MLTFGANDSPIQIHPTDIGAPNVGLGSTAHTIISLLIFTAGFASMVFIIIGGIRYSLSRGDEKAVAAAQKTLVSAIIGLVVVLLAWAILNFVLHQL